MSLKDFGTKRMIRESNVLASTESGPYYSEDTRLLSITPTQWVYVNNDSLSAAAHGVKEMPAGVYFVSFDKRTESPIFEKKELKVDELFFGKNDLATRILKEIDNFWEKATEYNNIGYLHRRGFLLYGAQGSGKTSIIQQAIYNIVAKNGLVFICGIPEFFAKGLKIFRKIEPSRNLVCLFEDIDAVVKNYGESVLLSILDGEDQIDKVFNIATTNYPELLDKRIVSRPRRFDKVIKVPPPDEEVRINYFRKKLPNENYKKWAKDTEGLSFAALAELIISVKCLDEDYVVALERLQDMRIKSPSSEESDEQTGFKQ